MKDLFGSLPSPADLDEDQLATLLLILTQRWSGDLADWARRAQKEHALYHLMATMGLEGELPENAHEDLLHQLTLVHEAARKARCSMWS